MKNLLLASALLCALFAQGQTKATAAVALGGTSGMNVTLQLNNTTTTATLTITGPADRWFALQIGSFDNGDGMQPGQDMLYYNGTALIDGVMNGIGVVPSADAANNWTMTSNTTSGTLRTVTATRPFVTNDTNDYVFSYNDANVDFAWARSSSASFSLANHGNNRGYSLNNNFTDLMGAENFALNSLKVYPNPASQVLNISNQEQIKSLSVHNVLGKVVLYKEVNGNDLQLDITSLAAGMHILETTDVNGVTNFTKLIVKN